MRLIYKGKQLPDSGKVLSDVFLLSRPNVTITVMHSTDESVKVVKSMAEDKLLRGPSSATSKYVGTPMKSAPKPTLFATIRPLQGLLYEEHARGLLEQLATHSGFYAAMKRRNFRVGVLAEMYPEGKVGKDPVCVMGYNVNAGAEIHLRLRTDDLQGFRPMHKIFEVLAHELAHNKHGDHGPEFKQLMLDIQTEAETLDWNYSTKGRTLATGEAAANYVPGSRRRLAGIVAEARTQNRRIGTAANSRLIREAEDRQRTDKREKENEEMDIVEAEKRVADEHPPLMKEEEERIHGDEKHEGCSDCISKDIPKEDLTHNLATSYSIPTEADKDHAEAKGGAEATGQAEEVRIEPVVKVRADSAELTTLISFGIPRQLAIVSLRNTSNDVSRAADFAYRPIDIIIQSENSALLDLLDALYRETDNDNNRGYTRVLMFLELYIGNVVRYPGVRKYARINAGNVSFLKNIAVFSSALKYLKEAGFRFDERENAFHAPDLAHANNLETITKAKDAIQARLLPLLRENENKDAA